VESSQKKLYSWFRRWDYEEKVPGPMAERAAHQVEEAWKKGSLGALQAEGLRRGIWDHAAFPKAKAVGEGGCGGYINRTTLLNPAERVFAEVRRWVEGRRYERIEAKKAAVKRC